MPEMQPPVEGLAFTITGRDIWDKLTEIGDSVAGVPAKVQDHEIRIRVLEKKVWAMSGLAAFLSSGATGLLSYFIGN